jgi:hypothetical protein
MIVKKNTVFEKNYTLWRIELTASGGSGELLRITNREKTLISCNYSQGWAGASVLFNVREKPLRLLGKVEEGSRVVLSCSGHYLAFYVDGQLTDEEWPIGFVDFSGADCREARGRVDFYEEPLQRIPQAESPVTITQRWRPAGYNTAVGDCMPFVDGGTLRLYYLFDRRHHGSKWGLGAHQWAQISTRDLKTWRTHPLSLCVDDQKEGSICTGSVMRHKDRYYAFYAVRTIDESPAWISWAVSGDGVCFTKTGTVFSLTERYHGASARDPCVFKDKNDLFHMLVTTSTGKGEEARGCLAHLESADLENWEEKDPLITLDVQDQPECSDYFYYKNYYYLVYSASGLGRYLISDNPLGPWKAPENNIVIGASAIVPKSCLWHNERLLFASWTTDYMCFGGYLMLHEAKQGPDGTLEFFPLPELG